ncbi:RpoH suppressor SuhR [soil metagenome]
MPSDWSSPALECDVIMKGGISSGVIYPHALTEFAKTYRFRGLGGASAGAIGAAFGAAAEFGRDSGGFERLEAVPASLGGGGLARLFQPQPSMRKLLGVLLTVTGGGSPASALLRAYPVTAVLGSLPGLALLVIGLVSGGLSGWLLAAAGLLVAALGLAAAVAWRLWRNLTRDVPENLFGICRGLATGAGGPGFTDWLAERIDDLAGLKTGIRPLTFGQLWGAGRERDIDLRMISTCLSQSRPYEMPWQARNFFYDPAEWRTLFPEYVVAALEEAPPGLPDDGSPADRARWEWQEAVAAAHEPPLRRLPGPADLPVIVATRMSLSFPLLIAAIPLFSIDFRAGRTRTAIGQYRAGDTAAATATGVDFSRLLFTDGGLTSNFPLHMFDRPLPTRPTFAINLGSFSPGQEVADDQSLNIEFADDNLDGLLPSYISIPETGFAAIASFVGASFDTARDWRDNSYLDVAGYRDRIVRVLQTGDEGGFNLDMDAPTIDALSARVRAAAQALVEQFTEPRYRTATGWDNHRWVRYRALMAGMPEFLEAYRKGRAALDTDQGHPPSYPLTARGRALADDIAAGLDDAATAVDSANAATVGALTRAPRPRGALRRVSQL